MNKTGIALGTFDGLHKGHIAVLQKTLKSGYESIAVTFSAPPKSFFEKGVKSILSSAEKEKCLKEMGFSRVVFLDFAAVKDISPEDFLRKLKADFNCAFISCGFNYRFGKNGAGDTALIADFCNKNGIEFRVTDAVKVGEDVVSSTLVRSLLSEGNVKKANELMYKKFGFSAEIIHGDARGRTIGFPTVNQVYPKELIPIKFGVYKTEITVGGKTYKAVTNIGTRPTYQVDYTLAETYIIDFAGDVYGKMADLRFSEFIRPEKKFSGIDELKKQIEIDIKK